MNCKKAQYEKPEIEMNIFQKDHLITTSSYFFVDEGYGDEVDW